MTTLHDSLLDKTTVRKSIGVVNSSSEQTEASISSSGPSSLAPESLSSASSFQSLSSKSSSGICADSAPGSPDKIVIAVNDNVVNDGFDSSYVNVDIPDLDDLISACANINLGAPRSSNDQESPDSSADLSQDQTFTSAADDTLGDITQVLVEETIQTFNTCPGLESQTSAEFKAPLPVVDQSTKIPTSDSSIIPYVSFEQSVLRKSPTEELQIVSQKVESPRRRSYSPTPCVEIDVAKVAALPPKTDNSLLTTENTILQVVETPVDGFGTPDVSFQEVQAFDSTVLLSTTDDDKSAAENPNLTTFVSAPTLAEEKEENSLNKTQDIVEAKENLSETREIAKENKSLNSTRELNKTQEIVKESPLNKTQEIVNESPLKKTQEVVKESPSNKTQEIVKENPLNKTQEIVNEEGSLKKTREIVKDVSLNGTHEIVKEENLLNKTQEIVVKENNSLNKTQDFVKEEKSLNNTQNSSERCVSNSSQEEQQSSLSTVKSVSVDTNKFDAFKEPVITVKTPSKLYERKEVKTPQKVESFYNDECQDSSDVVASTPLHWKKNENPRTPKRKSGALFNQELKSSPPQFPSPPTLSKNFQSPSKDKATKEHENKANFDQTVAVNRSFEKSSFAASELVSKNSSLDLLPSQETDYEAFKPQQQSTTLPLAAQCPNFEALQEAALSVAKEIDESLEKIDEEQFVSATTELFGDPFALDYLTQAGSQNTNRGDRYDSLYMKFDPLAQRQSMLPQKNLPVTPALEEEEEQRESKVETSIGNAGTPKKNPALAAIDRLLFYSPCPPATTDSEKVEAKQKKEEAEKKEPQSVPVVNEEMAKELELVRSTVLQLEAELEKQRQEHEKQLEKQRLAYDDKVMQIQAKFGQMQSQLSQETKCKDQMTVVVEEYEKSISRLIAEREKEKQVFTQERDRIKAELDISQQHLANSEAAFTDVHSKYERLKSVVTAYKSNEEVLKESIAENQETIKTLENRYEQLKSHAMAQLEKANLELSAIKKQHEADVLKLKAMVRKTELRCKTLDETVEQKSKENKELTQIIDEMIARVD